MKFRFCLKLPLLAAVLLGSSTSFRASAQDVNITTESNSVNLDKALRLALENNPEIKSLSADIDAAQGEVVTAKTWQNPEISFAPGVDRTREPNDTLFHGDFGLQQTIEWPGKRALRSAVAEKNVTVRRLALDGFRSQLAIQVRRAYYTLIATREGISLHQQRLEIAKSFAEVATKKVQAGFAPDFEEIKANLEILTAQKVLTDAQSQYQAAQVNLNSLMGRYPLTPLTVVGRLETNFDSPAESNLISQALEGNPGIKVQKAQFERMGLNLVSVRKSRLPDFKVGPQLEYTRDEQIIGFGVSLPIPLWDKKKGEIATATSEKEKAAAELERLQRDVMQNVATASQQLSAVKASIAIYSPALQKRLKTALDAASQSYDSGKTSMLNYLETQRTYFDMQSDYLDTLRKLYDAEAELESAVGQPLDQLLKSPIEQK